MRLAAFLLLGLLAEILGTVGGFGSSVFFVPLAQFFLDFHAVLAVTALFHVFSNGAKLILFWRHINHRLALLIGIPSVVFVVLGAYLTQVVDAEFALLALGIFLILFATIFLARRSLQIRASTPNAIAGGMFAGFLAGLLGTGGAIRGATLAAFNLHKEVFVATSAAIDLAVDASRSVVYVRNGYFESEHVIYIPGLIIVAFVGSYVGKLILKRFSQEQFRSLVLILLLIVGATMLARALWSIA